MKTVIKRLLVLALLVLGSATTFGQQIHVDEFGGITTNGVRALSGERMPDPSGGLLGWNVLVYNLPFVGMQGDVLIQDPFESGSPILDVLRFDGQSHLIFYSDSIHGISAPADTPGPPNPLYANIIFINEQVTNNFSFADYTPLAGQPGWDAVNPTYRFISEGVVPEPRSTLLILGGLGVFALAQVRRKFVAGAKK